MDFSTLLVVIGIYGGGALLVAVAVYGITRLAVSHALKRHSRRLSDG